MPRTKQPKTTASSRELSDETESLVRDFDRLATQRIHKMEADCKMQIASFESSVDLALSRLPTEIRKMTLAELLAVELPNVDDDDDAYMESVSPPIPKTVRTKKKPTRVTAASDDGYATECTTKTTHGSKINTTKTGERSRTARSSSTNRNSARPPRTTRSSSGTRSARSTIDDDDQHDRKDLLKVGRGPPKTCSKFKTPMAKNSAPSYNVVTPKVKPNTPMNILRRPRDGEMVLSMQGSPLLVSSIVQERVANINLPLHNGNVVSLLPNAGLRRSLMPELDPETMRQLQTLKGHIDMVLGSD